MKTFTGKITLTVSEQNLGLIPLLIEFNGGKFEEETNDEAVCRIMSEIITKSLKDEAILKNLSVYFGVGQMNVVESIKQALENGALVSTFTAE